MRVTVQCITCGWSRTGRDVAWVRHAGKVHAEILRAGHEVTEASRAVASTETPFNVLGNFEVLHEWNEK